MAVGEVAVGREPVGEVAVVGVVLEPGAIGVPFVLEPFCVGARCWSSELSVMLPRPRCSRGGSLWCWVLDEWAPLVIHLCCIVLAVSAVCVIAYLYSLSPLSVCAQVIILSSHFLSVLGQWALLVFKQTDLRVGVVGTTSDRSVLEPTAPSVLDAIGDPSVLEP